MSITSPETLISPAARLRRFLDALGPGILLAGAAIGGSHLVSATQAGAMFGWALLPLCIGVNLAKYPFFYAVVKYSSASGETVLDGYVRLGRGYIWTFLVITLISALLNIGGVVLISASLAILMGIPLSLPAMSVILTLICTGLVLANRFALFNALGKFIVFSLFALTITAAALAIFKSGGAMDEQARHALDLASIGFVIQFMGWMPAPIDVAAWSSIWAREQDRDAGKRLAWSERAFDFNLGYIGTAVLAVVFLVLGKAIYGDTTAEVPMIGGAFARDLVTMYAAIIGDWARPLAAGLAFLAMFSSAVACFDAWPRSVGLGLALALDRPAVEARTRQATALLLALLSIGVAVLFVQHVSSLLFVAMVVSFCSSPVLAWFNLRVMSLPDVPPEMRFGRATRSLSYAGLLFLGVGCLAFLVWLVVV